MKGSGGFQQSKKVGLQSFFCIVCGAVGSGWQYSCQGLKQPWKRLSCLIYRHFLACKLSTFNALNPLEISAMKTLIIHEISPPPTQSSFPRQWEYLIAQIRISHWWRPFSVGAPFVQSPRVHSSSLSFGNKMQLNSSAAGSYYRSKHINQSKTNKQQIPGRTEVAQKHTPIGKHSHHHNKIFHTESFIKTWDEDQLFSLKNSINGCRSFYEIYSSNKCVGNKIHLKRLTLITKKEGQSEAQCGVVTPNISRARSRNFPLLHVCVAVRQRASCTVVLFTYNTEAPL